MNFQKGQIKKDSIEQLEQFNNFSVFQSNEFSDFITSIDGFEAYIYSVENNNQLLGSCLVTIQKEKGIKAQFSKRAIIYGGPVINESEAAKELLNYISKDLNRKVIYIETRNFHNYNEFAGLYKSLGWNYLPYMNVQVSLENQNIDSLMAAMKYNRRREIKLSIKEGCEYRDANSIEEVEALYEILYDLYVNRVRLPLPSKNYFLNFLDSSVAKVFVVIHNSKVIGGAFCLFYPKDTIYTIYYCGIRAYHKKIFPTHLAIIAAMDFGITNGLKRIDLMGAGKKDEEYGVRKYKAEFGGEIVEDGRFIKITKPLMYKLGKLGLKLLKK
jgi:lipid II:glycine glycyltransferase (peptidoglycan interpeptide bridge formation enzyme)